MSFCHLVPPQDTKWHNVPLSGEETKWHKAIFQIKVGNHGNNNNCIKGNFDAFEEDSEKILVFGKLFGTTVVSMTYQLKFLSLVTMATNT